MRTGWFAAACFGGRGWGRGRVQEPRVGAGGAAGAGLGGAIRLGAEHPEIWVTVESEDF